MKDKSMTHFLPVDYEQGLSKLNQNYKLGNRIVEEYA